jgi:FkbM family methyltransferase
MKYILSYSQNAEDVVLRRIFRDVHNGFYVDIGAGYPSLNSVSKYLYDSGWSGINIEPQSDIFNILDDSRTRDTNLNVAIDKSNTVHLLNVFPDRWGLATISEAVSTQHSKLGLRIKHQNVQTHTLTYILDTYAISQTINLLKIDVEGYENEVIESLDFNRYLPEVIVIESTMPNTSIRLTDTFWEKHLMEYGYKEGLFDGINSFYIHENNIHDKAISPANHRDHYVSIQWWALLSRAQQEAWLISKKNEGHDVTELEKSAKSIAQYKHEMKHMYQRSKIA